MRWMWLRHRRIRYVTGFSVLLIGVSLYLTSGSPIRVNSATEGVEYLLFSPYGRYAVAPCIAHGNETVHALVQSLEGEAELDYFQSVRVAEVLSGIHTPDSILLAKKLWLRAVQTGQNPTATSQGPGYPFFSQDVMGRVQLYMATEERRILPKCVGAYILARNGELRDIRAENGFLVRCLNGELVDKRYYSDVNVTLAFAVLAVGFSGDPEGAAVLCPHMSDVAKYGFPTVTVEALALNGTAQASDCLATILQSWVYSEEEAGSFMNLPEYGVGLRAFRALLSLERYDCVATFLAKVPDDLSRSAPVLSILERLTGKRIGTTRESLQTWWARNSGQFSLTQDELDKLRKEIETDSLHYIAMGYGGSEAARPVLLRTLHR